MKRASITLMIHGDKAWIARRPMNKSIMPGLLECAGGSQDGNETALETAIREVKEEANLWIANDRFTFVGVIFVDGWQYSLYFVTLDATETPKDVEPTKRDNWFLCPPGHITLGQCSPALGALLSIWIQEQRVRRGGS